MSEAGLRGAASSMSEMASASPGAILRRCREFHGLTLEEASDATRIGASYLKALEDDHIQEFANKAYLKGFLRIYANYLGLNSEDVARMYDRLFGVEKDKSGTSSAVIPPNRSARRYFIYLKKMLLPALLLVAILITATFFKHPPAPPSRPLQQAAIPVFTPQSSAIQLVQSSARVKKIEQVVQPLKSELRSPAPADLEPVAPSPTLPPDAPADLEPVAPSPTLPPDAPAAFILKIKVTQSGTLTATVDGTGAQQYELAIGDVIEWKAEKSVALELSNAGGVEVELNGKPYKALGSAGKPVYVELDADGVVE